MTSPEPTFLVVPFKSGRTRPEIFAAVYARNSLYERCHGARISLDKLEAFKHLDHSNHLAQCEGVFKDVQSALAQVYLTDPTDWKSAHKLIERFEDARLSTRSLLDSHYAKLKPIEAAERLLSEVVTDIVRFDSPR
jgi:hypothetical protein